MFKLYLKVAVLTAAGLYPVATAQTTQPQFEVATIKPNKAGGPAIRINRPSPLRWESENTDLMFLITNAWNVRQFQVIGGPDWLQKDRFDVQASMATPGSTDEVRLMLRSLLHDRFQLRVNQEQREQPVYVLKQARRGTKLRPIPAGSCVTYDPSKPPTLEPGQPQPKWCGGTSYGPNQLKGTAITMTELVRLLEDVTHRPVIDKTDLRGQFDIDIKWTADERTPGFSANAPPPPTEPGPSLFTVLEEELGLTLDTAREQVNVLVIQSVQQPSEN